MPVLISKLLEGRVRGNNDWIPNASWKESFRIEKALMNPSQCVYECTNTKVVSSWLPMVYLLLFGLVWYRHHPIMCCWSTEKCGRYHQIPKMPLSWKGNFTLLYNHSTVKSGNGPFSHTQRVMWSLSHWPHLLSIFFVSSLSLVGALGPGQFLVSALMGYKCMASGLADKHNSIVVSDKMGVCQCFKLEVKMMWSLSHWIVTSPSSLSS